MTKETKETSRQDVLADLEDAGVSMLVVDSNDRVIDIVDIDPDLKMETGDEPDLVGSYEIQNNAKDRRAYIKLQGPIGGPSFSGAFLDELDAKAKTAKNLDLVINSTGGSVFGAVQIYNALVRHPAKVRVKIEGVAASAATLIAMAGDEIHIAENATMMFHEVRPTEKSLESMLELVQRANEAIKKTYHARTGISMERLSEIFDSNKDHWYSADEAVEAGFADKITPLKPVSKQPQPSNDYQENILCGFEHEAALQLVNEMDSIFDPEPVATKTEQEPAAELELALTASADSSAPESSEASNESEPQEPASDPEPQQPVAFLTGTQNVFESWLEARLGADEVANLTPEQRASWKSVYDGGVQPAAEAPAEPVAQSYDEPVDVENVNVEDELRAQTVAFFKRRDEILAKCSEFPALATDAIAHNWGDDILNAKLAAAKAQKEAAEAKAQLEAASQEDPGFGGTLAIHTPSLPENFSQDDVVACAFALSLGMREGDLINPVGEMDYQAQMDLGANELTAYAPQVVDAARKMRGFGLQELISHCAGHRGFWRGDDTVEAALGYPTNSFSSARFPKVLEEIVNRNIIAQYKKVTPQWDKVAQAVSVQDYRETMFYRVFGSGPWDPIECGEVLKHGQLDASESHRVKAKTWGQVLSVCHEHIVNGDLGPITSFVQMMATQGRFAPEFALWDLVSTEADTNAGTFDFDNPQSLDDLWVAWTTVMESDPNDTTEATNRNIAIGLEPGLIVYNHRNDLKMRRLLGGNPTIAAQGALGGNQATFATTHLLNLFSDRFTPVSSPLYSHTDAVSLMTAPNIAPAYKIAFLFGRQTPTLKRLQPANNMLGVDLQGTIDFGVTSTDSYLRKSSKD